MGSGPNWAWRSGPRPDRVCARRGCGAVATTTLRFLPTEREAWLVDLDDAGARAEGDLCARHATVLLLPRDWVLRDRRGAAPGEVELPRRSALRARRPELVAVPVPETRAPETAKVSIDDQNVAGEPLSEVLDAQTPLLRRAFQNVWPFASTDE